MTDDEKKFDPHKLMDTDRDVLDVPTSLVKLEIQMPQGMLDAMQYIIENAQGLGYESIDEFVRSAIRDKVVEISTTANR